MAFASLVGLAGVVMIAALVTAFPSLGGSRAREVRRKPRGSTAAVDLCDAVV